MKLQSFCLVVYFGLHLMGCAIPSGNATSEIPSDAELSTSTSPETSGKQSGVSTVLPEQLTVTAKFRDSPTPYAVMDDDGSTVTGLLATIEQTTYSVPINDFLDLKSASSKELITPSLNGCSLTTYSFDFVGPASEILQFGGRDPSGDTSCQDFLKSIGARGLRMKFTDVPLHNRQDKIIKVVFVNVSHP